jgi:hypothetical protein
MVPTTKTSKSCVTGLATISIPGLFQSTKSIDPCHPGLAPVRPARVSSALLLAALPKGHDESQARGITGTVWERELLSESKTGRRVLLEQADSFDVSLQGLRAVMSHLRVAAKEQVKELSNSAP